jgi:hypothetical protein
MWNLIAAVLATIGAGVCAVAMYLSEHTLPNVLSFVGCTIGAVAGVAWIIAAAIPMFRDHD